MRHSSRHPVIPSCTIPGSWFRQNWREHPMSRLRMAVIGVGHLGKEHARILATLPAVDLVGVVDVHVEQAQAVARRCGTRAYADYRPLLDLVDAAVVVV